MPENAAPSYVMSKVLTSDLLLSWGKPPGESMSLGPARQIGPRPGQFLNSLSVWFCSPCVEKDEQGPISEAWDVDPGLITKLKEQYKKERKGKKGVKSKSCRAMLPPSLSSLCRAWLFLS